MTKDELLALADRVEAAMLRETRHAIDRGSGVTGQQHALQRASHYATVLSALRAQAAALENNHDQ